MWLFPVALSRKWGMDWFGESHIGLIRPNNEDCFGALPDEGLWIVCDGMGGHAMGEQASRLAVDTVLRGVGRGLGLKQALMEAHRAVAALAHGPDGRRTPGSTACALRVRGRRWECAWVGDSRLWSWDGRRLRLLTLDHTRAQRLVKLGIITLDEAETHPQRHVLVQCLGMKEGEPEPEMVEGEWREGMAAFILTTDGAVGHEDPEAMERALRGTGSPKEAVRRIIEASLEAGGRDNITAVVVDWPRSAPSLLERAARILKRVI